MNLQSYPTNFYFIISKPTPCRLFNYYKTYKNLLKSSEIQTDASNTLKRGRIFIPFPHNFLLSHQT